jgi:cAMP-dependent protein kinase regulator
LNHFLFETLSEEDLVKIVDCMKQVIVLEGGIIIKEGDPGDLFYVLESGHVTASNKREGELMRYSSGGCFGELALLYNCPRGATVFAATESSLWTIDLK